MLELQVEIELNLFASDGVLILSTRRTQSSHGEIDLNLFDYKDTLFLFTRRTQQLQKWHSLEISVAVSFNKK